jgi:murein DD-endopeptidase MepM/ murein hydrolase activator NlpD
MSITPDLHSPFMEFLVAHNRPGMDGFTNWVFHPGMMFGAAIKWWGEQGRRPGPHEGLDLHRFLVAGGLIKTVDQLTNIPAAFAGQVVKIQPDFLGQSIFMSHAIFAADGRRLITAFGHTVPRDFLSIGASVAAGEVIATVAGFPPKATDLLPHLHLTFAWAPEDVSPARLTWENLGRDSAITLIDPLPVISPPL